MTAKPHKAVAVVGPTASGKTSLAIRLAKEFRGEIVSADSRQLYRGTAVCTDIPPGKWRSFGSRRAYMVEGVPHYLMNSESPARPITMAQYRRRALWRLKEIASRGKLPMLVGGTGLYVRAVVDNFDLPEVEPDPELRERLERQPLARLYARLKRLDPDYAARTQPQNRRYIVRALEVIETTGKPFSAQQGTGEPVFDWLQLGVSRPREELYRRIDHRVDQMESLGLFGETERLARRYGWDARIMTSLGYGQLRGYFLGEISLEEGLRLMKRDTRHYARRQLTWLRRDDRIKWVKSYAGAAQALKRHLK